MSGCPLIGLASTRRRLCHPVCGACRIDVALEEQEDSSIEVAQGLLSETRALLRPSTEGDGFERSYYEALQRTPDVVLAHASVKKLISSALTSAAA